jgi:inorganic pyrophosphatase
VDIDKIAVGPNPPQEISVIVEVPLRSDPIKYELDKAAGAIVVDRFLCTTMFYPAITASCRIRLPWTATRSTSW